LNLLACLLPVVGLPDQALDWLEPVVTRTYGFTTRRLAPLPLPDGAFDAQRGQYDATLLLRAGLAANPSEATRLLVVTDLDIFVPMLTFIFGQAQVSGPGAILSLARLRQEFYGLPPRGDLLVERARKETLHELGHTFGLVHCRDLSCAMALSINVTNIDIKRGEYCSTCASHLDDRLQALRGGGPSNEE
jgi:archaemetzincin